MKKIQHLVFAGCMTLAGLCQAQQPLDYWMVVDKGSAPGSVSTSYTDTPPTTGDGIAAWTNASLDYLMGRYVVLQQYEESVSNQYFVSLEKVTQGQYADNYSMAPGDLIAPLEASETTKVNVTNFLAKLSAQMNIPVGGINASGTNNAYVPLDYDSSPESFYLYIKTIYQLTVDYGTGSTYTNGGEIVSITADDPAAFVKWVVDPPDATNDFGIGFVETDVTTSLIMPFYDVTVTASYEYELTVFDGVGYPYNAHPTNSLAQISISAATIPEKTFTEWTVSPSGTPLGAGFDATALFTTIIMPPTNILVSANYEDTKYPLTVVNGSGNGDYVKNAAVLIEANTPPTGFVFDCWTNEVGVTIANPLTNETTVTILGTTTTAQNPTGITASVTAVYKPRKIPQNTYMIVNLAGGSTGPDYLDEPPAGGWDNSHKTTQMVFRKVPAGSFTMGSPAGEAGRGDDETQHAVTLTKDFYLGLFEVTQAQWQEIEGSNPSHFTGVNTRPVEQVSYEDIRGPYAEANWPSTKPPTASSFMGTLRSRVGLDTFDLPTEAQWEYACRAGTTGAYAGEINSMAWYNANSGGETHEVGSKSPNAWGFYDMHGNVSEICLDWWTFAGPGASAQTDPEGAETQGSQPLRVLRGGAYDSDPVGNPSVAFASAIRSAFRDRIYVTNYMASLNITNWSTRQQAGFRVAVPQAKASYALTVVNGVVNTGGVFEEGTKIGLTPAPAPDGEKFAIWQVVPAGADLGTDFDPATEQPRLTMPSSAVTVTAVYMPTNATGIFRFVINNPGGVVELLKADGATFALTAPAPSPWYRFTGWAVSPAGANLGTGFDPASGATTVLMPAHDVTVTPNYTQDIVTPTVGVAFTLDASEGQAPAAFSAKGLPSGLKIDRNTGMISGTPSKAGTFNVQVTAKRSDGTTVTYTVPVIVQALPANAQGTFTGYIFADGGASLDQIKGLVTLKVSVKGALSVKVDTQSVSYRFSTKAWASSSGNIFRAVLARKQGEALVLELDAATGILTSASTFGGGALGAANAFNVYAQRNAFLDKNNPTAQAKLAIYKGYYTVALPVTDIVTDTAGANNTQQGSGYLTMTIRDRGAVKVAGKLADGTRVSLSTTLIVDGSDAYVPLFTKLYSRRGVFAGLLQISGSTASALRVAGVSDTRLEWIYPGRNVSMTGDRFNAQLGAYGAFYNTLADIQTAYAGMAFRTEENFGWPTLLVAPGASGSLVLAKKGPDNPDGVSLKAVRKTGLFSGSFKTTDMTGKTVTLKHAGVLTRDGADYVGDGAYIRNTKTGSYTLKSSYWVEIAP